MILVLSSQRFSPLILVSNSNVFSVISTFERNEPFQNVSPYVSLKVPLVRSYDLVYTLVDVGSHNVLVFCYRLFPFLLHSTVSLPSVSLYVTSSHYSPYVSRFVVLLV